MPVRLLSIFLILGIFVGTLFAEEDEEGLTARLSQSAYGDMKSFQACYGDQFKVSGSEINGVQLFTLREKHREIVVFRGTDNMVNWLTNLKVEAVPFKEVPEAKVHNGFYEIAQTVHAKLSLDKEKLITVTGHSLGGAVALLYGALLHDDGYDVRVITFGAPPVGNDAFAEANVALEHIRFAHIFDPVPKADRKTIATLQSLLENIDIESLEYGRIKQVLLYLKSMPYDFVHHGEERDITHILTMDTFNASELMMQPVYYHGMDSYMRAFDGGSEE